MKTHCKIIGNKKSNNYCSLVLKKLFTIKTNMFWKMLKNLSNDDRLSGNSDSFGQY